MSLDAASAALLPVAVESAEPESLVPLESTAGLLLGLAEVPVLAGGAMLIVVFDEPAGELEVLGAGTVRSIVRLTVVLLRSIRVTLFPGTTTVFGVVTTGGATMTVFVALSGTGAV